VRLGQSAPTLSGGEAQRVKLAGELQKRSMGRTIYVLDEPTTGLHFEDIRKLLLVLQGLVDKGNSVIVIEHNLDVIKTADWVVDLGPEGGSGGGLLVAEGTPEEVAAVPESHTGRFLADLLEVSNPKAIEGRGSAIKAAKAVAATAAPVKRATAKATATAPAAKAPVKRTVSAPVKATARAANGSVAKAEPAKVERAKAGAAKAEPVKTGSGRAVKAAKAVPVKAAPAKTASARTVPVKSAPAKKTPPAQKRAARTITLDTPEPARRR
jgi:excinuclease ABC subunit A